MTELRDCEECGGDGGWEAMPHSPVIPPHWSVCTACDGKGEVEWTTDDDEPVADVAAEEQVRGVTAEPQPNLEAR
jgi:hypothetical protein